jgi:hypothetical protein
MVETDFGNAIEIDLVLVLIEMDEVDHTIGCSDKDQGQAVNECDASRRGFLKVELLKFGKIQFESKR